LQFHQAKEAAARDLPKASRESLPGGLSGLAYRLISGAFLLIGLVSRHRAVSLSRHLALLWYALDRRHREVATNNLTYVFGCEKSPAQIRQMARRVFAHIVFILFEIGWMHRAPAHGLTGRVRLEGLENLRRAYKDGRGVLILTGHLGNWEILANAAGLLGFPLNVVYRPMDFLPLDLFFRNLRGRFGARLLSKRSAARDILRALHRRELVGILLDQNAGRRAGVFVDFFGKPACTNRGLALMAQRTGAPVVPMFLVREGDAYRMIAAPPVQWVRTGDRSRDIRVNTRRYNQVLESFIRRYPEQWFWVHRRWKTRPKKECRG
jgi:KDO2-lipid IV(A) lauroyltransferase